MSSPFSQRTAGQLMRSEIAEQPAIAARIAAAASARDLSGLFDVEAVLLVGRGTSRAAAQYGASALALGRRLRAMAVSPTLLGRYRPAIPLDNAAVVCISQSGRSREVIEAASWASSRGARVIALTNDPGSPLARAVSQDAVLPLLTGLERAIPATKTMTAMLMWLLAIACGPNALKALPQRLAVAVETPIDEELEQCKRMRVFTFVAEGAAFAAAEEGAIKFRETLAVPTLAIEASDVLHGSIAAAEPSSLLIGIVTDDIAEDLWQHARAAWMNAGASAFALYPPSASGRDTAIVYSLADVPVVTVLLQRLALECALARGRDPDRPPHTTKLTDVGRSVRC